MGHWRCCHRTPPESQPAMRARCFFLLHTTLVFFLHHEIVAAAVRRDRCGVPLLAAVVGALKVKPFNVALSAVPARADQATTGRL